MLRLDTTTRTLQVTLGAAPATTQLPVVVSYSDKTATAFNGATQTSTTTGVTAVTIASAPAASTVRTIDYVSITNTDSAQSTVTVLLNDNGTTYKLITSVLQPGDSLVFTHSAGWNTNTLNNTATVYRQLFTAGSGFVGGTTTTLTLNNAPATGNAVWVYYDGAFQQSSEYAVSGSTITFTSAIPAGVLQVEVITTTPSATLGATTTSALTYNTGPLSGFRNRVINGDMRIDQRFSGAATTPTASSTYLLDRFTQEISQASKLTYQQVADAPAGFKYSLKASVATAFTSSATDYFVLEHRIEGQNLQDLGFGTTNATNVSVSFWAKSSLTGQFSLALKNANATRSYIHPYTITTANTWQKFTFTLPGDITGTWTTDTTIGMFIDFDLGCGSNRTTSTTNAWIAGDFVTASGSVALVANAAATLNITGLQLEVGTVSTPFEVRPYGTELQLCQRYYQTGTVASGSLGSTTAGYLFGSLNQPMRVPPTFSSTGTIAVYVGGANQSLTAVALASAFTTNYILTMTLTTASTAGFPVFVTNGNASQLLFNAEL